MSIEQSKIVVDTVVKRLSLPKSNYELSALTDGNIIEFVLYFDDGNSIMISIDDDTLRVVYDNDYNAINYDAQKYQSSISLLYKLLIILFSNLCEYDKSLSFNYLLSLVFVEKITDWKDLLIAILKGIGLYPYYEDDCVYVDDIKIYFSKNTWEIIVDDFVIDCEDRSYVDLVKNVFATAEYVLMILDKEDCLFGEIVEEEKPIEENDRNIEFNSFGDNDDFDSGSDFGSFDDMDFETTDGDEEDLSGLLEESGE